MNCKGELSTSSIAYILMLLVRIIHTATVPAATTIGTTKDTTSDTFSDTSDFVPHNEECARIECCEDSSLDTRWEANPIVPNNNMEPQSYYDFDVIEIGSLIPPVNVLQNETNKLVTANVEMPAVISRAKRDLHNICCGSISCECKQSCPTQPLCPAGQVVIELSPGTSQPGSCCITYECGEMPACEAKPQTYWLTPCLKCNSCAVIPCMDTCGYQADEQEQQRNCLTGHSKIKLHGETWAENSCANCICVNGESQCTGPLCAQPDCVDPIKIEGECCAMCPEEVELNQTTTESLLNETTMSESTLNVSTESVENSSTSESNELDQSHTTQESAPYETTTSKSMLTASTEENVESSSASKIKDYTSSVTERSTTEGATTTAVDDEMTVERVETTQSVTMEEDITSELPSSTITTESAADSSSTEIVTTSEEETTLYSSTEIPTIVTTVSTTAPDPLMPEFNSYHKDPSIKETDYRLVHAGTTHPPKLFNNFQGLWPIVILLSTICLLSLALILTIIWLKQRNRKNTKPLYSSVPNSDTNLSETNTTVSAI